MSRVVTLVAEQAADLGHEIQRHLGLHSGDPLVLIEGEDFVLVKKASARSLTERFDRLSAETRRRFEHLRLGSEDVEHAVAWARESS